MEQIFGADLTYEKVSEEKFEKFLVKLREKGLPYYLEDYEDMKNSYPWSITPQVYLDSFCNIGEYGVHAFLKDVISHLENIDITCETGNGHIYVGLKPLAPWEYNESTVKMSEREYAELLSSYLSELFDEDIPVCWDAWKE